MKEGYRASVSPGANARGPLHRARIARFRTVHRTVPPHSTVELAEVAGDAVLLHRRCAARRPLRQRRPLLTADRLGQRAARVEAAAARRPRRTWRIAAQQGALHAPA